MIEDQEKLQDIYLLIQTWRNGKPGMRDDETEINILWAMVEMIEVIAKPEVVEAKGNE